MNVQDVKIKDIVVTQNSRIDMKGLEELMQSIKDRGLLQPIGVGGPTKDGKYIFEYGRRRLLACEKLGWTTIPANITAEKKYKDLIITNLIENIQRKDLTVAELGRICTDLKEQGMNAKEIAVSLGVSLGKVEIALDSYSRVPARFRRKVSFLDQRTSAKKGHISATATKNLLGIRREFKLKQDDFEKLFESAIEEQLSASDIKTVAGLMKTGMTASQSLKEKEKYKDYSIIVTVDEDSALDLAKRYKVFPTTALQMIIYGEIQETLKRPKFVKA